jgi:chromosome segregation ATPase
VSAVVDHRVGHRTDCKQRLSEVKRELRRKQKELVKATGAVHLAIELKGLYACKATDTKGRAAELAQVIATKHPEVTSLEAEVSALEDEQDDLENQVSEINYYQRERQTEAMRELTRQLQPFERVMKEFTKAVELLSRKRG